MITTITLSQKGRDAGYVDLQVFRDAGWSDADLLAQGWANTVVESDPIPNPLGLTQSQWREVATYSRPARRLEPYERLPGYGPKAPLPAPIENMFGVIDLSQVHRAWNRFASNDLYPSGYSTEQQLLHFVHHVIEELDNGRDPFV